MSCVYENPTGRFLRRMRVQHDAEVLSDRTLLARFHAAADEVAFEALLRRHGPMVFGVCRRVLPNAEDAADAFQATFLILVRKARAIGDGDKLSAWLYGVAHRTALRARTNACKRRYHESQARRVSVTNSVAEVADSDLHAILDEEIQRLPLKYRSVVVLCYVQAKSMHEAAHVLDCPTGTVKGRLARAREMLERRLRSRGITVPTAGLAALFSGASASAAVPTSLMHATLKAVALGSASQAVTAGFMSASAAVLVQSAMKAWSLARIALVAVTATSFALVAGGLGGIAPVAGSGSTPLFATSAPIMGFSKPSDPKELYQKAVADFFQKEDMPAAEKGFQSVVEHPKVDAEMKKQAAFYHWAAVGRQNKHAEALKLGEQWLTAYPKDKSRNYMLLFQGEYHLQLKDREKAKKCWQEIVKTEPDSDLGQIAKHHLEELENGGAKPKEVVTDEYKPGRVLPAELEKPGGYVVVTVALDEKQPDHVKFQKVAEQAAAFHKGEVVPFDGRDFTKLADALQQRRPQNVLFVIPPEKLDVQVHRRILLMSAGMDADIFPDFAFGYFTARNGDALEKLWNRTVEVHQKGLRTKTWMNTAVASSIPSTVYPDHVPDIAKAAGFSGKGLYFGCIEKDPDVMGFVRKHLPEMNEAAVIEMTGNGDPQGIWLFSDQRNIDRKRHWNYEPAKVGHDPKGEMPRILAKHFADLRLQGPVVWSGTCHSAATRRVYVEADIISTFGRTDKCTVHSLDPEQSMCLALVDAGAVAYLAPSGPNHGMSVSREVDFALANGASLGETIKSTYDDVFMAARGKLRLDFPVEGQKHVNDEAIMQGGGANRVLIGDPSLRLFKPTTHPHEKADVQKKDAKIEVTVKWDKGFHPWGWDMFGLDRQRDWRIGARIPLDDFVPPGRPVAVTATIGAKDADGKPLPYVMKHAEPEVYHGRRWLHLQANVDRKAVDAKAVEATFVVTFD